MIYPRAASSFRALCQGVLFSFASGLMTTAHALVEVEALLPPSLKTVPVPEPANLGEFVRDKQAAIALGKALFWDQQVGSDRVACASCHFHAGADNRSVNQLNPGRSNDAKQPNGFDLSFTEASQTERRAKTGVNYPLKADDFPFYRLADPADRNSEVTYESDDVVGSQGVHARRKTSVVAAIGPLQILAVKEVCRPVESIFESAGKSVRQTTGRNAPSVINAVFNFRNFWDGRANNVFNGMNPFGNRFPQGDNGPAIMAVSPDGRLERQDIAISDASLASQAVGPAMSDVEMTCGGTTFPQLGRKMLHLRPLALQSVDPEDSVLGPMAAGRGLQPRFNYRRMIMAAFQPKFWDSDKSINGFSLMENNFSLFWGLAIQLYEATLVANDTPYDRYRENPLDHPLTDRQLSGMNLFAGKGLCMVCHRGSEFTGASKSHVREAFVERMFVADGGVALYDTGFYNIGVRPTAEDPGLGGTDPWNNPLSFSRQITALTDGQSTDIPMNLDPFMVSSRNFLLGTGEVIGIGERDAVDGSFKTPGLRNVELTGPYFHNGSYSTLRQVIEFYHRGGNRRDLPLGDSSGYGSNPSNLAPDLAGHIDPWDPQDYSPTLNLTDDEMDDLVEFLLSLTDERVRWEQAPFDHPSLWLAHAATADATAKAKQKNTLPAVGAGGRRVKGLEPLRGFAEYLIP